MASYILLFSILSALMVVRSSQAQEHIGCFTFNHGNTVLSVKTQDTVGPIAACIHQCKTRSATYAGVSNGYNCYCGDNHNHTVNGEQLSDSSCTTTCNDHTDRCGGQFSIVIYSVCSLGRYRDSTNDESNCDASCNCADNHTCLYNTGSCPANCEAGWSGVTCNVRVSDVVTPSTTYGISENMTTHEALSVTPCDRCPGAATALLAGICVTSLALVICIIVIIYLVYRLHVAGTPEKQSSAKIRATHNSSERFSNDTSYENMGVVQTEPSNYEQLGSRPTNTATYEELNMAGPTRG